MQLLGWHRECGPRYRGARHFDLGVRLAQDAPEPETGICSSTLHRRPRAMHAFSAVRGCTVQWTPPRTTQRVVDSMRGEVQSGSGRGMWCEERSEDFVGFFIVVIFFAAIVL